MEEEPALKSCAYYLERAGWLQVLLGMLTQMSAEVSFPSYNIVLGFWATFCSFSKSGRATFGYITFSLISVVLDVIFCTFYGPYGSTSTFKFALAMFIFCLFVKVWTLSTSTQFFHLIGGTWMVESSFQGAGQSADQGSIYEPMQDTSRVVGDHGKYQPPNMNDNVSSGGVPDTSFAGRMLRNRPGMGDSDSSYTAISSRNRVGGRIGRTPHANDDIGGNTNSLRGGLGTAVQAEEQREFKNPAPDRQGAMLVL